MDKSELPFLSASELSRLIASREVSPVEATEAYLDRIDSLDFKFNAYLTVTREMAMEAAREAEREIVAGSHRGPMHGVPVAVKDQFHSAGVRTTGGSRISGRLRAGRGRHSHRQPQAGRGGIIGQDQPDRVRHHGLFPPIQHAAQSVGPERLRRGIQQRFRGGYGRIPMRHVAGRGHRWLHPLSRYVVRPSRLASNLGACESLRGNAGGLVNGHRRPHLSYCGGRRHHAERDRGPRPQGRAHLYRALCLITGPRWAAVSRACASA